MDLLIEDQLLRPSSRAGEGVRKPSPVGWPPTPGSNPTTPPLTDSAATATVPLSSATAMGPTSDPTTVSQLTLTPETTTAPAGLAEEETPQLLALASTVVATATESLPAATSPVLSPAVATTAGTLNDMETSPALESSPGAWEQERTPATPVSPTIPATPKQALEEEDIRNIIGECFMSCTDPAVRMGAGSCPQCVLLSAAHLDLATGGSCHGDDGWASALLGHQILLAC